MIEEDLNGHLFDVGDVKNVVNCLLNYQHKLPYLNKMGQNGFNKVKNQYEIDLIINKHLKLAAVL
jgi:hypothetical protein